MRGIEYTVQIESVIAIARKRKMWNECISNFQNIKLSTSRKLCMVGVSFFVCVGIGGLYFWLNKNKNKIKNTLDQTMTV